MTDLSHDLRISREALAAAERRADEAERALEQSRRDHDDAETDHEAAEARADAFAHAADAARVRAAEAERAVAAMRGALVLARRELATATEDGGRLPWRGLAVIAEALSTPIGSGWLSPEQGAEKVKAEREACALIADGVARSYGSGGVGRQVSRTIAFAIRSRFPAAAHPTEANHE